MSVESTITKVIYVGNGVATEWPVPFKYNKPEHLHLLVTDAAGAHELVTSNFQVQVTEAGDTSILYPVSGQPLAAGKRLTIFRATPQTQIVDLIYGGAFAPEVLEEDGLDREVMMIQELQEGLDRAVKVGIDSDETPEELLENIFTARDEAEDAATSAKASANAAAESSRSAAGSAAIATEEREAACICAGEAKDARDVAIAQAEAANTLMEAELAKVNAIVAANRTDQQVAVTAARQWAEKEADVPVEYDEEGKPRYSARHWAENAQKIAIEPPTAERRGAVRVGAGLHLETAENGEKDVLAVSPDGVTTKVDADGLLTALGGSLLLNSVMLLTESGTFEAPVKGWYFGTMWGGGSGGIVGPTNRTDFINVLSGASGGKKDFIVYLEEGQEVPVVIGAGGPRVLYTTYDYNNSGGNTSFGDITVLGAIGGKEAAAVTLFGLQYYTRDKAAASIHAAGAGRGGGRTASTFSQTTQDERDSSCHAFGHFGGGGAAGFERNGYGAGNGAPGSIYLYWHDPAKAAGPLPEPALLSARRMASRAVAAPATVNLYDPVTGQGSVWREEDAEAKLAEGMITQEAWEENCAAKAAEDYAAWLADPDTEAERFEMLRLACEAKLAETDKLVHPDYPISDETRAALLTYRKDIRELNHKPGAPWDGGGELTPWPEMPTVSKKAEEE